VPGTIQAEDFDNGGQGVSYFDTTTGNSSGLYRPTDVDIEASTDTGGGFDVMKTKAGEWLQYSVNVTAAGTYPLDVRIANIGTGGTFHVEVDGVNQTGAVAVPDTGGWQTWQTVTTPGITMSSGLHVVRLSFDAIATGGGVGNYNWIRFVGTAPPQPTANTPHGGTPWPLPGTVQAEDYDDGGQSIAYSDTTSTNSGNVYRTTEGVDLEASTDTGGGYDVMKTKVGEWLKYTVNVTAAGTYPLDVRIANIGTGGVFHVEVDGFNKTGPISVPDTGGWQVWQTVSIAGIPLTAGQHVVTLKFDTAGSSGGVGNYNWFRVGAATVASTKPFGGTAAALPGAVQSENFDDGGQTVAWTDTTAGNSGGVYRTNVDVDLEASADTGGGYDVMKTRAGEWLNYTVDAPAGTYPLEVRVANIGTGARFHVEVDGVDHTGEVTLPDTGGWQNWQTVPVGNISLTGGTHVIRFVFDTAGTSGGVGNFNWFQIGL